MDPDKTAPIGTLCSGSTLFASILNSSVMLGNYLQQMTSADDIFRCNFSWRFKGKIFQHHSTISYRIRETQLYPIYILYIYYIQARVFKISQNDKLLSENHETTEKRPLCIQLHKMRYDCVIHRISNIVCIQF